MNHSLFALLFTLSVAYAQATRAAEPQLPSGWRLPSTTELSPPGQHWRDESPTKFQSAKGDFDGDGQQDEAVLLVSSDSKSYAVFFHAASGAWKLLTRAPMTTLPNMGLFVVAPGKHQTACGKGHWQCKKGEPKALQLSNEAILFFAEESASAAFVWSSTRKKFEQVWLSD